MSGVSVTSIRLNNASIIKINELFKSLGLDQDGWLEDIKRQVSIKPIYVKCRGMHKYWRE